MKTRFRLMQQIAELDLQLSQAEGAIPPTAKQNALSACAEILDESDNDDEHYICGAIQCLIRKHGLELDHYWHDDRAMSG